jgi:hypothetical protein
VHGHGRLALLAVSLVSAVLVVGPAHAAGLGPDPTGLQTQTLAAGVDRILSDVVGRRFDPGGIQSVAVDDDGVWLWVGLWTYDGSSFDSIDPPGLRTGALDREIAPDGSIWAVSVRGSLYRVDDGVDEGAAAL